MILIIISIALAILAFFAIKVVNRNIDYHNTKVKNDIEMGYKSRAGDEINYKVSPWWSLVALGIVLFGMFSVVPTGVVGVKTAWGKVTGSVNEGLVVKAPWEEVYQISTKVQKIKQEKMEGSTKDLQMISGINIDVNYQVAPAKAVDLYSRVGVDYPDVIIVPTLIQSVKSQIAQYNAEELANARGKVAESIASDLNVLLGSYGIQILAVSLNNFDFSREYSAAIESKAVALQETQAAEQRLEKSRIESEQKVVEANAQAEANRLLQTTITDHVLQEEFIKKWNGELPKVMGSDAIVSADMFK